MRIVIRGICVIFCCCVIFSCVSYSNLYEGIHCFRSQQYHEAYIKLKPEAYKGQPEAQYAVGYMYYYGQGVVENRKKAWYWIHRAASRGQPDAMKAEEILIGFKKK